MVEYVVGTFSQGTKDLADLKVEKWVREFAKLRECRDDWGGSQVVPVSQT